MTPDCNDHIAKALTALDALRVSLIDLSSDVDVPHHEELDAERVPYVDDPFSSSAVGRETPVLLSGLLLTQIPELGKLNVISGDLDEDVREPLEYPVPCFKGYRHKRPLRSAIKHCLNGGGE